METIVLELLQIIVREYYWKCIGERKEAIGNGLKNRKKGGDEYIMKVDLDDAKSGSKTKVAFFEKRNL